MSASKSWFLTARSTDSFLSTTTCSRNRQSRRSFHPAAPACKPCRTCSSVSAAPVVSITLIRGRVTGVGSELALACDMRFASREKTLLSQWEVGAALVPGGGPMARLPRLIGRGRALEVLLGADDIPGDLAERYGYVNRALPDAELDAFVEALAVRIASFDKQAVVETKNFVDIASLPPDAEIAPEWDACIASIQRPAGQRRINTLLERGLHKPGDVENRLGYHVGQLSRDS